MNVISEKGQVVQLNKDLGDSLHIVLIILARFLKQVIPSKLSQTVDDCILDFR